MLVKEVCYQLMDEECPSHGRLQRALFDIESLNERIAMRRLLRDYNIVVTEINTLPIIPEECFGEMRE